MSRAIRRIKNTLRRSYAENLERVAASLGDGSGKIEVAGHPDLCYARVGARGVPMKVKNTKAAKKHNARVWIGRNRDDAKTVQVLGSSAGYALGTEGQGVGTHAPNHFITGADPVYIDTRQIVNLGLAVSGLTVTVYSGMCLISNAPTFFSRAVIDLSSHRPATGARWVILQAGADHTITALDGAPHAAYGDLVDANIPSLDFGHAALWAIKLYAGQVKISTNPASPDYTDLRFTPADPSGAASAALRCIWHFSAAEGAYRAYEPSDGGLAEANAAAAAGDAITIPEGAYQGFALKPAVRYTCHPDALFTSTVELAEAAGWEGGRIEFNTTGAADAIGLIGPAASGIVVKELTMKIHALGSGNAYAIRLQGGWVACQDTYLRAAADDPAAKARLYYSQAAPQAICNADQCVFAYATSESAVPANWKVAEGVTIAAIGCGWPEGYTPDANISYRPGDRSAITHTHTESQITDLEHDAVKLQGRPLANTAPADGQMIRWNQSASQWEPGGVDAAPLSGNVTLYGSLEAISPNNDEAFDRRLKATADYINGDTSFQARTSIAAAATTLAMYGNYGSSRLRFYNARGNESLPADLEDGDAIGMIEFEGEGGSYGSIGVSAQGGDAWLSLGFPHTDLSDIELDGFADFTPVYTDVSIGNPAIGSYRIYARTGANPGLYVRDGVGNEFRLKLVEDHVHTDEKLLTAEGTLTTSTGKLRLYNLMGGAKTIVKVFLSVDTPPVGSPIIVDVNKNGATIFTTQANRPQITSGANTGQSTSIDVSAWAEGEYLTMDVDQVGSGTAGADLTVHIVYTG